MNKSKLTRTLMAAVSVVALSAVMYGCVHSGGDDAPAVDMDALNREKGEAAAAATAAAAALAAVEADKAADMASYDKAMAASADAAAANTSAQAATTVEDATKYSDMAQAAKANAEKYAGMVTTAAGEVDAAQMAAAAAAQAARTAATDAAGAVAAVEADKSHDPSAYAVAVIARESADAAADAAEAANAAAQAAQTPAAAKAQQAIAETAQGNAEAARDNAQTNAAMVTAAKQKADNDAAAEAQALADARTAAATAASAAADALTAANTALEGLADIASADTDSYAKAMAAQTAAKAASDAAAAANQAAMLASNSAQAQLQQAIAESEQGKAEAAQSDAEMYAGMVRQAKADQDAQAAADKMAQDMQDARLAATDARMKAQEAAASAATARTTLVGTAGATPAEIAAASDAKAAADAAVLRAIAAELEAGQATTVEAAQAAQADAEQAQMDAEAELGKITMAQGVIDGRNDAAAAEAKALKDAQDMAKQAAMDAGSAATDARQAATDARAAATSARAASDRVAELAPDSASATAAANAATAAETAAAAAETAATAAETAKGNADTANQAAQDADTSEAAKAAQRTAESAKGDAETAEGNAETAKMTAQERLVAANALKDAAELAHGIGEEQRRQQAVDDARTYGAMSVNNAKTASDDAADAAAAAKTASDNANAAYMRAVKARTDSKKTKEQADAAKAAYMAAKTAADAAQQAYMDAKAAVDGVMDDDTVAEATAARTTANTKAGDAAASKTTAMTKQKDAEGALAKAVKYAEMHVIGLLQYATGQDIVLGSADDVDIPAATKKAQKARLKAVATAIGNAAKQTGARNDSRSSGEATANGAAATTWAANTPANPDATPPTKEVPKYASVTITDVGGSAVTSVTMNQAVDASDPKDGDFTDSGDTTPNAKSITGPSGFMHGFDISGLMADDKTKQDGRHVIAFTDRKQDTLAVPAKTVEVSNIPVTVSRIVENTHTGQNSATPTTKTDDTKVANADLDTVGDLTSNARYDHDGNPETLALAGTFSCVKATDACSSVRVSVSAAGEVLGVVGDGEALLFTTAPTESDNYQGITKAAVAAKTMNDFLTFGVWLQEASGTGDDAVAVSLGAFAGGGSPVSGDTYAGAAVTGSATYNGAATGLYSRTDKDGSSVAYFQGAATLTANFGTKPTTGNDNQLGVIYGKIDNIYAGGVLMSDVIHLDAVDDVPDTDDNAASKGIQSITAAGLFDGRTRMGAAKTDPATGQPSYTYNGTWSGQFYNGKADDSATANVNESQLPPGSVAGTFGVTGTDNMGTTTGANAKDDDVTRSYVGAFGAHKQ